MKQRWISVYCLLVPTDENDENKSRAAAEVELGGTFQSLTAGSFL